MQNVTEDYVCLCIDTTLDIEDSRAHLGQEALLSFLSWPSPSLCCMSALNLRYFSTFTESTTCQQIQNMVICHTLYTIIYNVIIVECMKNLYHHLMLYYHKKSYPTLSFILYTIYIFIKKIFIYNYTLS